MAVHLVCYANESFRHAQDRLVASAGSNGVDIIHRFSPDDFRDDPFFIRHHAILSAPRGAGYCLWKPYVILKVLAEVPPGDFVLYADCGATLVAPVQALEHVCRTAGGILLFRNHGRKNRYWVKRDCFVLLDSDTPECHDADQVYASFSGYEGGATALEFVEEWLTLCLDPRVLTDTANSCGLPDLPEFIAHMYDQSVLSVLAHRRGMFLYRVPTVHGNHLKPECFRVPGEPLELPYSPEPYPESPYPTLFDHARNTSGNSTLVGKVKIAVKRIIRERFPKRWPNPFFTSTDLANAIRRNRNALSEVSGWYNPSKDSRDLFRLETSHDAPHKFNKPVGDQPTLTDLLVHLAEHLKRPIEYFELGVSVGMSFFQIMRAARNGRLTGVDIAEIRINLSGRLTLLRHEDWTASPQSYHRKSSMDEYSDPVGNNSVRYFTADLFDDGVWLRLAGSRFNCLFLDAVHYHAESWSHVWQKLREFDLIDRDDFVIVWDDLGRYTSVVFERAAADLASTIGKCSKFVVPLRGIIGVNEYPHQVGVLANLGTPPSWFSPKLGSGES